MQLVSWLSLVLVSFVVVWLVSGLFWPVAGFQPAGWSFIVGQPLAGGGQSDLSSVGPITASGPEDLRQGAP